MSFITFEIAFIILLTILNGIFAMTEIAVVSARKARLQQWAESGNKNARLALEVSNAPEEFLSTVQIGITLVGVLAGAFGGATIAQNLATTFATYPILAPYAETIAIGLVVISITYLSLILGELVPKRIALNNPERIAAFMARPMRLLSRATAPVVWLLSASTSTLLWLFRLRQTSEPPITEEEIKILLRQGAEVGAIERDERDIIERVFRLGARRASTLMTPRKELVVLYVSDSLDQVRQKIVQSGHSVFPLCEQTLDNVLGVVRIQEIFGQIVEGKPINLKAIVREALFLPESVQSLKLLKEFKKTGKDIALLLDEYGGLQGLITATDILKAVVGEVSYLALPKAVRRPDGSWLVDGMLPLDEFKEVLKLSQLPEESHSYETAGGFVMALLGRIPSEGDSIQWGRYRFEIVDMDGLRVDKILVTALAKGVDQRGIR
jgi:putative hemolysin